MTYFIATIKAHGFKLYDFAEEIGLTGAALSTGCMAAPTRRCRRRSGLARSWA